MTLGVQRALVTGADGLLGRHLISELERHGTKVTGLTRRAGPERRFIAMGDAPWDAERLARILDLAEPDVVFHLAGRAAGPPATLEQVNVGLARAMMAAMQRAEARPVLLCCGSAAEYGAAHVDGRPTPETAACEPVNAYGASKLAQTQEALAFAERTGIRVLVARIFNPIGPGMPPCLALGAFARQLADLPAYGGVLHTGNPAVSRDFMDVGHAARGLHALARNPVAHGVVNVCSGVPTRLDFLVALLIAASGKAVRIAVDPARMRSNEVGSVFGDPALLSRLTGMLPQTDQRAVIGRIWTQAQARAEQQMQTLGRDR